MTKTNEPSVGKQKKINGIEQPDLVQINEAYAKSHQQRFNMAGYAASKLNTVRIGIIGYAHGLASDRLPA